MGPGQGQGQGQGQGLGLASDYTALVTGQDPPLGPLACTVVAVVVTELAVVPGAGWGAGVSWTSPGGPLVAQGSTLVHPTHAA